MQSLEQRLFFSGATHLAFLQLPSRTLPGISISPAVSVAVEDASNIPVATDTSTVTITLNAATFSTGYNSASAPVFNGVAAFSNLQINVDGSFNLTARDGALTSATSSSFMISGYGIDPLASFVPFPNGENPDATLAIDPSGNLFGTTSSGGTYRDGTVFEIPAGSSTITTIASFNGTDGASPNAGVTLDSNGDIFGTASGGGYLDFGTVFEIPAGSTTITTLALFKGPNGNEPASNLLLDSSGDLFGSTIGTNGTVFEVVHGSGVITTLASLGTMPQGSLTMDSSGNLFGTTSFHSQYYGGTIFEIPHGTTTLDTLAYFYPNTLSPEGGVSVDSSGNLFGTTYAGGTKGDGTYYELAHNSTSITTLANFTGTNGQSPRGNLVRDSSGDLFGTTYQGGSAGVGTVFEIPKGTNTITVLASLNTSNGAYPYTGVVLDSANNLLGTAFQGGTSSAGTVFEVAHNSSVATLVASFVESSGANPEGKLTFDSAGDVFGTSFAGGVSGDGTVFEITNGSTGITTLASFIGTNGAAPGAGVTLDSTGDLFGTTGEGGTGATNSIDGGTVFEIVRGSGAITTLGNFNGSNGYDPGALVMDSSGNLFGVANGGGYYANGSTWGDGTIFEIVRGSNAITTLVTFNGSNGSNPVGLTFDSNGNLLGVTQSGGTNGDGTIFEIPHGSTTLTTLINFNSSSGGNPQSGLTLDAHGDMFGTTGESSNGSCNVFEISSGTAAFAILGSYKNGAYTYDPDAPISIDPGGDIFGSADLSPEGALFEIPAGSTTLTTLNTFNGTNGSGAGGLLSVDSNKNLTGTSVTGGTANAGAIFKTAAASQLVFTLQPTNTSGGAPIGGSGSGNFGIQVTIEDAAGNVVADNSTVTLTLSNGATFGNGASSVSVAAVNGVAAFTYLVMYAGGTYTVNASDGTLPTEVSTPFTISSNAPAWLAPSSAALWDGSSRTLSVVGSATIIADPGSDEPIITASSSSAIVAFNPSGSLQIHIGGLSLFGGASATVYSLGTARSASNHRVLIVGVAGATTAPAFTIDALSQLNLADNDLLVHTGNLKSIQNFVTGGYNARDGYWNGAGITASTAAIGTLWALGVAHPSTTGTFDGESVASADDEVRYTYYGDANLSGTVDSSDYTLIDAGYLSRGSLTGWYNGDFNYDGVVNGSDYTLIDNAFNNQGASLASQIASTEKPLSTLSVLPASTSTAATEHVPYGNSLAELDRKRRIRDQQIDNLMG